MFLYLSFAAFCLRSVLYLIVNIGTAEWQWKDWQSLIPSKVSINDSFQDTACNFISGKCEQSSASSANVSEDESEAKARDNTADTHP